MTTSMRGLPFLLFGMVACHTAEPPTVLPHDVVRVDTISEVDWGPYAILLESQPATGQGKHRAGEHWWRESDSVLVGNTYIVRGTDTVGLEELKLERRNGRVVYTVRTSSANWNDWTTFHAVKATADSLEFENPGHDFPQCITYVRGADGTSWSVNLSGMESGTERHHPEPVHDSTGA